MIWYDHEQDKYEIAEEVINGIKVQILINGANHARIERILSTNPSDYLNNSCQPGQEIEFKPRQVSLK